MPDPQRLDLAERRLLERGADVPLDQPWNPLPELKAGDRVRVVSRAECQVCPADMAPWADGRTGVIGACPHRHGAVIQPQGQDAYRHVHAAGHDYTVVFDEPVMTTEYGLIRGGCLARSELQRIQEVPTPSDPTLGAQRSST